MKVFFDDLEFDAQFARTVGKSVVGMADVGECFAAASRMTPGDYGSWRDSWHLAAERVEHIAEAAAKAGRRRSAGEAYLRASEYHRASYFFDRVDLAGSFLRSAWEATKRTFQHGLSYLDVAVEVITVRYAGTRLTGYLIRPERAGSGASRMGRYVGSIDDDELVLMPDKAIRCRFDLNHELFAGAFMTSAGFGPTTNASSLKSPASGSNCGITPSAAGQDLYRGAIQD